MLRFCKNTGELICKTTQGSLVELLADMLLTHPVNLKSPSECFVDQIHWLYAHAGKNINDTGIL